MLELALAEDSELTGHPSAIGRYRILRLIGAGGMGSVYEAEQDLPRRIVALKIVKPGLATPELLRRFELESQALGRLQHPGIAQIYEAGTEDTGLGPQPYFAMEFIRGKKLTDYAEEHHLNTRQRMEMMSKIAEAVHHAHQRGLIHRDLKPANILVDEAGQPKIVDFGVARTTDGDMQPTDQTTTGQLVGTLAYMSPEQVLADPLELDTRSDVYSLGVILYELLAGRLPYTISGNLHVNIQAIREAEPARLSAVDRTYRGDIETIVGKALEKDKAMRYASATGLAADIHRYLRDDPIAARPPSGGYQLRKFARRNKAFVAGIAAAFVALVVGVVAFAWMANLARLQADNANIEKGKSKAVLDFTGACLFGKANPSTQGDSGQPFRTSNPNIPLKDALDLCVKEIPFQFDGQPLLEAAVREFAADAYTGIGRDSEGRDQLESAVALHRRMGGDTDRETLQATGKLADAYSKLKIYPKAEEAAKRVVLDARRSTEDVDPYVRRAVTTLVAIYGSTFANPDQSRGFSQIERFLKDDVIDYQRKKSGEADSTVQFAIESLLFLYTEAKPTPKYSEAAEFMKGIVNNWKHVLGEGHPATLLAEKQLIGLYLIPQPQPRYPESEAYLKLLLEAQRKALGDENPATQNTLNYLVSVYLDQPQPRYAEVEPLLKRVIKDARRSAGNESRAVRTASIGLANLYFKQARYAESADLLMPLVSNPELERALADSSTLEVEPAILHTLDRSQVYGGRINFALADSLTHLTMHEQPTTLDVLDLLAQIHIKQGDSIAANAMAIRLRTILEAALKSEPKTRNPGGALKSMVAFAIRYIDQERYSDADDLLKTVLAVYRKLVESEVNVRRTTHFISELGMDYQPGNDRRLSPYQQLAQSGTNAQGIATALTSAAITYSSKGRDLQAGTILKAILDTNQAVTGDCNWDTQLAFWRLASWYMDRARYDEARGTFDSLSKIQAQCYGPGHTITRTTMVDIVGIYWDRFQVESAGGRKEQGKVLLQRNLDIRNKLLAIYRTEPDGATSGNSRMVISNIGIMLALLERYQPAAETFKQLIAIEKVAEEVPLESVPTTIANLGWTQFHQRNLLEAEASLRKALGLYEKIKSDSWERYNTESMLGATLAAAGKYDDAEPHLLNSYEKLLLRAPVIGPASGFTAEKKRGERILAMFKSWGKPAEEVKWLQKMKAEMSPATISN